MNKKLNNSEIYFITCTQAVLAKQIAFVASVRLSVSLSAEKLLKVLMRNWCNLVVTYVMIKTRTG